MRDISAWELVGEIKTGWNLGNTFDAPHGETSWNNPETTFTMLHAISEAGFDSVRLPVTWNNHLGDAPDYKIDEAWLDRVEEVVGYILATGMYCILNTHHEHWLYPTEENEEQNREQLLAIWRQLCERFADYNEKLIFESMNEPRLFGTQYEWNGGTYEAQMTVARLNAAFVETVRASGGNNAKRHLMLPSYAASAEQNALTTLMVTFPRDDDKLIASIHAYVPDDFALSVRGTWIWNAEQLEQYIDRLFDRLTHFLTDEGIPVIIGETGAMIKRDNLEDRIAWTEYYFGRARELGIPAYWWDNGIFVQNERQDAELFGFFCRYSATFVFPEILDAIIEN
jgi:endoglucanase